jgi:hypothetical protein
MTPPNSFAFAADPHVRKHAPAGYRNYQDHKPWLRDEFEFRYVYCLQREMWSRERHAVFSVDHIIPQADDGTLVCVYGNLVYACLRCNSAKQDVLVLDPTHLGIGRHLRVETDGIVTGLTDEGKFLIELLHLNAGSALGERRRILRVLRRREKYPGDQDVAADFREAFGYPEELPDLRTLRPPVGNPLEANEANCFYARREKGELPDVY